MAFTFIQSPELDELVEDLDISEKKSKRSFLTIEEIKVWKNVRFAGEEKHLERDRDIFLLQIYTGTIARISSTCKRNIWLTK